MPGYGRFCPVAKAMELLDARWTMLVVRARLGSSAAVSGPAQVRRAVPTWIGQSLLSAVSRPA
ncbi:MAG: hypothetical protein M3Y83_03915 [Actinomycetota bacterium]|nr:hypothetical protein [Actinomycetota bacterium]